MQHDERCIYPLAVLTTFGEHLEARAELCKIWNYRVDWLLNVICMLACNYT